ncbi:class F sortase [Streptomyces piniterrae]|uniref:Class F sortase n=1 Tax=Streptomyces piniterrae TaxID=2571125 RepID=A0A4U0MUA6_9ACTN|nr:class F sortase [Streptomyces piniterrae]TJZ44585.1 class F sortase [Streptomyces piniterrae]
MRARIKRVAGCFAAAAALVLVSGCGGQESASQAAPVEQPPAQGAQGAPGTGTGTGAESGQGGGRETGGSQGAAPQKISVPSLDISSSLVPLGRKKDGAMETPADPGKAGWYTPGPAPGEKGPAVIAGHVSWNGKPAVFHRLSSLKAGDAIEVARTDGKSQKFTVSRVAQYPKNKFPTIEVYKNVDYAGLRLITCGGQYDASQHYYPDNVVVFAKLAGAAE